MKVGKYFCLSLEELLVFLEEPFLVGWVGDFEHCHAVYLAGCHDWLFPWEMMILNGSITGSFQMFACLIC